jgi:hypothetical protein
MNGALPIWIIAIPFLVALVERFTTPKPVYVAGAGASSRAEVPRSNGGDLDVVSLLEQQHAQIKTLFLQTLASTGPERAGGFLALRQLLAAHEALEEEIVHPAAVHALETLGKSGREIVRGRLEEERTAATSITQLESLPIDSVVFEMSLRKLQHDVVEHADHEERFEFVAFERDTFPVAPLEFKKAAESVYAEGASQQRGASRDVGRFVAMLNRAREAIGTRTQQPEGV